MDSLLKLKNVNLKYQIENDTIKVLKNINLETKKNESISIVGESGSGKTSLIMLVGGLEKVTSGKIFFEDQEISKMSEDEVSKIRRKNIGIVFQSFYLIPNYTAVENVALTLELNNLKNPNERAKELLDRFGLKNRFNNLPSQLSGGEQQRIAIARALYHNPKVLILDEATSALDNQTEQAIMNAVNKLRKDLTIILIAHRLNTVFKFDGGKLLKNTFNTTHKV